MSLLCARTFAFAFAFAGAAAAQAADEPPDGLPAKVSVAVGTQRVLTVPGLRAFAHAALNPGCGTITVRPAGEEQLLLIGETVGEAKLLLFTDGAPPREQRVRVRRGGLDGRVCELCRMLPAGYGADVRQSGAEVFVAGTMTSIDEALAAGRAKKVYPQIRIVARLREDVVREALLELGHALWRAGFLGHRAVVREGRVALVGPPLTPKAQVLADAAVAAQRARLDAALQVSEGPDDSLPRALSDPCSEGR